MIPDDASNLNSTNPLDQWFGHRPAAAGAAASPSDSSTDQVEFTGKIASQALQIEAPPSPKTARDGGAGDPKRNFLGKSDIGGPGGSSNRQIVIDDPDLGPLQVTVLPPDQPDPTPPAGSKPTAPPADVGSPLPAGGGLTGGTGTAGPPSGSESTLGLALTIAGMGLKVFPLSPGSKVPPEGLHWKAEATTDPAKIEAWFAAAPEMNYGVATGGGLIVIDLDLKPGTDGAASLADLEGQFGKLADTLTVRTPSGGQHLYFLGDDVANSAGKLGRGIDVRGAGGYVVAPGSYFADHDGAKGYRGSYEIEATRPVAAAPEWLVLMAGQSKVREDGGPVSVDDPMDIAYAIRYLQNEAPPAVEGEGGNNTAYQVAARLHEIGLSADVATELLAEHWNPRCAPPWEHGALVAFAAHAELYAQNRQGSGGMAAAAEAFTGAVPLDETEPETARPAPTTGSALVRRIIRPGEERPTPRWLVKGVIPEVGRGVIGGPPGAGKSTLALDLAAYVARGEDWFGHRVRRQAATVILAFEGSGAMGVRLDALQRPAEAPLAVEAWDVGSVSPTGLRTLVPTLQDADRRFRESHGFGVGLIIVDTISASGLLTDENSNSEVAAALTALEALAASVGAFGMATHHPPKHGVGLRGAGAFRGNSDVVIEIDRKDADDERAVRLDKVRDGREGPLGSFVLGVVELGIDDDGDAVTACIIKSVPPGSASTPGKSPKWTEALLDAFEHVAQDRKIANGGQVCIPETYAREIFDDRVRPQFKAGGHRKAWKEAFDFAIRSGALKVADGVPHAYTLHRRVDQFHLLPESEE